MDTIEFAGSASPRSLWDLSEPELAESCRRIAEGNSGPSLRAEALRLFILWVEVLNNLEHSNEAREARVALLSGLRKRTIQILVRLMIAS